MDSNKSSLAVYQSFVAWAGDRLQGAPVWMQWLTQVEAKCSVVRGADRLRCAHYVWIEGNVLNENNPTMSSKLYYQWEEAHFLSNHWESGMSPQHI